MDAEVSSTVSERTSLRGNQWSTRFLSGLTSSTHTELVIEASKPAYTWMQKR